MIVLCSVSILFGCFLFAGAYAAFGVDEPEAGLIAAATGTVFILAGMKGMPL